MSPTYIFSMVFIILLSYIRSVSRMWRSKFHRKVGWPEPMEELDVHRRLATRLCKREAMETVEKATQNEHPTRENRTILRAEPKKF